MSGARPVVFVRLPASAKRVTALLVDRRRNGTAVVYTRGRTFIIPRSAVGRARTSQAARVIAARLRAEYAGIEALAAPLLRRRGRGLL